MTSAQDDRPRYLYRLDASDRIIWVCPQWLQFASANDFPPEQLSGVLGSVLWNHIVGLETRRLYQELFAGMRERQSEIAIPFNCDSPTLVRNMTLTIRSLTGGALELEGRLNNAVARPYARILDRQVPRSEEILPICSLCRRLRVRTDWVSVAEALVRRRLFTQIPVPRLNETLCPACNEYPLR